jgi:3-oxoadipate enol-lactonase/4-carboxymuconolactone decarboxylase
MPFATRDGVRLHWVLEGEADRPPLVLLNSIGTDIGLWDRVVPLLLSDFRVLRLDTRGHGASDAPGGDYSLAMLAADVVAVMDAPGIARAAIAGVSLGGMIAMQLALDRPERVSALALICTSATMDTASWAARVETVRVQGTGAIADMAVRRFLSPGFASRHPDVAEALRHAIAVQPDTGYAGAAAAIRDMTLAGQISRIAAPTMVVTGALDVSTPYAGHGDILVATIPHARDVGIEGAHLAPIEAPASLAAALRRFLDGEPTGKALIDGGFARSTV